MDVEKLSSTALNEVTSAQQLQHCAWLADCVPWQTITTRAAVTTQRTSPMASEQKETRSDSEKLDGFFQCHFRNEVTNVG